MRTQRNVVKKKPHPWNSDTCPRDKLSRSTLLINEEDSDWFGLAYRHVTAPSAADTGPSPSCQRVQAAVTASEDGGMAWAWTISYAPSAGAGFQLFAVELNCSRLDLAVPGLFGILIIASAFSLLQLRCVCSREYKWLPKTRAWVSDLVLDCFFLKKELYGLSHSIRYSILAPNGHYS